jgi:hypothetical protein
MHKNKALVSLVFGLGIILIGGISLLAYGLYQRGNDPDFKFFKTASEMSVKAGSQPVKLAPRIPKLPANISIPLAKGTWVSAIESSGSNIIVHITNEAKRDQLLILDVNTGAVLSRIRFDRPQ